MGKSSKDAYGATGSTNLLTFDPKDLKLITDEKHPLYDPRVHKPIDETMVASIMAYGVEEPVIVWKDPENGDVCVVAGRQRVKNNVEANKRLVKDGAMAKDIKAIVKRGDPKALMATMAIENEGRTDNTPSEKAKLAQKLIEAGYTEDQIAIMMHCSKGTVTNYLKLIESPASVRNALDSGKIDPTTAYKLAKYHPAEQKAKLDAILEATKEADETAAETTSTPATALATTDDASTDKPKGRGKGKKAKVAKPPKKSRKGTAKKIREIVSGVAEMQSKRTVTKFLKTVEETEQIKENIRQALVASLGWVLGKEPEPTFEEPYWRAR